MCRTPAMPVRKRALLGSLCALAACCAQAATEAAPAEELPPAAAGLSKLPANRWVLIHRLDGTVLSPERAKELRLRGMLARDAEARRRAAAALQSAAWREVKTVADWERFRDRRLQALRAALGQFPAPPADLHVRVTGRIVGDGCAIEKLAFESRPGLVVTANLYLPARPAGAMPGILISHSHHNPKTQEELQDMGMTWAREGCAVLVMDHLGHGERRQHPFARASQHPQSSRFGRQDYYFRYNAALQLELIGDSLMGWMVWDLRRGLDLLLSRPGIDKQRVLLIGAVAGGGDPAGVTAALDPRITAVAPFNFGGPQPDYAIPAKEDEFYWFGVPYWETTRALRGGARDGFAHWMIVASVAPRRLLYCHEFAWDRARDPAWPRIQRVFALAGVPDHLAAVTGKGTLQGSPPESTHCNNVGPVHRAQIYPVLRRWFDMPVPDKEFQSRRQDQELLCLNPAVLAELRPRTLCELAADLGRERLESARRRRAALEPEARRRQLRKDWATLLGEIEPAAAPSVLEQREETAGDIVVRRLALQDTAGIVVPALLLRRRPMPKERMPVVIGVAQQGKQAFLKDRPRAIAELLEGGAAVCLPDLRGTGETAVEGSRDFRGEATSLSQAEWLLGQTLLGGRLRDLRSVIRHLKTRPELDAARIALWGDSLAPANAPERELRVPLDLAGAIPHAEPLGGLAAVFAALYDDGVRAILIGQGLASYESLLESPFCYVPHDAVVPGALTVGDIDDLIAAIAPRPVRWDHAVDGLNRPVGVGRLTSALRLARRTYASLGAQSRLVLVAEESGAGPPSGWLLDQLKQP